MTGYGSSSRGKSLKLPLCLRVSEPSGSLTCQLTGWNVSPACLVTTPVFPLCSPLTAIRTLLPIILRSRALHCSRSDVDSCVGAWASRRRVSCSWRPRVPIRWTKRFISSSSSSEVFRSDMVSVKGLEDQSSTFTPTGAFRASEQPWRARNSTAASRRRLCRLAVHCLWCWLDRNETKVIFWLTTSRRVDGSNRLMEAIAHRLSSEEVNVVWLLIHSVIASRLVSSREFLYIVQDDHDRAVTARIFRAASVAHKRV